MNEIAKKIKENKPKPLYVQAAEKFEVSYVYVNQIAIGARKATRGKGLLVKNWLMAQITATTNQSNN